MSKLTVAVTGARGLTGAMIVKKLLANDQVGEVRAVMRGQPDEPTKQAFAKAGDKVKVFTCDLTAANAAELLKEAFTGADAVVVATGSQPKIVLSSLPGVIFSKMIGGSKKPSFYFPPGQAPKQVDYEGQVVQFDAAKAAGVKHVVIVSSMGGNHPDHFLNANMDKVVLWKRKAEKYLVASGLTYTIVHPGGLLPHHGYKGPCAGGERVLHVGLNDAILEANEATTLQADKHITSLIPRADVAEVCVNALFTADAKNRSFDMASYEPGKGEGSIYAGDLATLLKPLGGKNTDYSTPDLDALLA